MKTILDNPHTLMERSKAEKLAETLNDQAEDGEVYIAVHGERWSFVEIRDEEGELILRL